MSLYEKRSASAKKTEVHNALLKAKEKAKEMRAANLSGETRETFQAPFPVYGENSFATAITGFMSLAENKETENKITN